MPTTAALTTRDLSKRYDRTTALDAVDLEVAAGELVGLLGPNGAGKSTLVKIACGLVRATAGTAEIAGAPAGSRAARASTGYLADEGGSRMEAMSKAWSAAVLALAFRRRDL